MGSASGAPGMPMVNETSMSPSSLSSTVLILSLPLPSAAIRRAEVVLMIGNRVFFWAKNRAPLSLAITRAFWFQPSCSLGLISPPTAAPTTTRAARTAPATSARA